MAGESDPIVNHLAEAEAALWLGESLMLSLVRAGILDKEQAVETIDAAIEAKRSVLPETATPEVARLAIGLLAAVANSIAAIPEPAPAARTAARRQLGPRRASKQSLD